MFVELLDFDEVDVEPDVTQSSIEASVDFVLRSGGNWLN